MRRRARTQVATDAPLVKKLPLIDWLIAQKARMPVSCALCRTTLTLICAQVNLDAADYVECTALHVAAALGDEPLTTRLLKAGASPRARDAEGLTSLHLAVRLTPGLLASALQADVLARARRTAATWAWCRR